MEAEDELSLIESVLHLDKGWKVTKFETNDDEKTVEIYISFVDKKAFYSEDEPSCKIYDLGKKRRVRHLSMFEYKTYLNFQIPRVILSDKNIRYILRSNVNTCCDNKYYAYY